MTRAAKACVTGAKVFQTQSVLRLDTTRVWILRTSCCICRFAQTLRMHQMTSALDIVMQDSPLSVDQSLEALQGGHSRVGAPGVGPARGPRSGTSGRSLPAAGRLQHAGGGRHWEWYCPLAELLASPSGKMASPRVPCTPVMTNTNGSLLTTHHRN